MLCSGQPAVAPSPHFMTSSTPSSSSSPLPSPAPSTAPIPQHVIQASYHDDNNEHIIRTDKHEVGMEDDEVSCSQDTARNAAAAGIAGTVAVPGFAHGPLVHPPLNPDRYNSRAHGASMKKRPKVEYIVINNESQVSYIHSTRLLTVAR